MRPKNRAVYRFAIPVLTLVTVIASVLLWDYTVSRYGDMYKGYANSGRLGEVISSFVLDPAVFLTAAALVFLSVAAMGSVVRAMRARRSGAFFFLLLIVVNVAIFIAIMYIAVSEAAG